MQSKRQQEKSRESWHRIPQQDITPETKRELRLLKLRGALDGKRFYKKNDTSKIPTRFQFGTVVSGAHEFYSSRISKRDRQSSFTKEVLSDARLSQARKKKYRELQEAAQAV